MVNSTVKPRHTNKLAGETSPYLLQHAHNPVDWYPWGDEALLRAKSEDRLILLSIGYSACHWCHVMERESFEDEAIAALMNDHYVNIKVDREERPDLDDIYMAVTVAMNRGQGGWPMTVFLTPDCEPVFAGTYFPPENRQGHPGFPTLLAEIARAWREDRGQIRERAHEFSNILREQRTLGPAIAVGEDELRGALAQYTADFDSVHGGFGAAPKFPPATSLMLLLRLHVRLKDPIALSMVRKTLDAMARGGMYDQVGGGFCRYSTDDRWLVPHFEKMLYDNALLARAYLEAYQLTRDDFYRRIAIEILDYVLREMTSAEGGFFSSTDADSEGVEGKFFVWTPDEVKSVLGDDDAELFNAYYDITEDGNWEGKSIPNTPKSLEDVAKRFSLSPDEARSRLDTARAEMYTHRNSREKPGLDDKILTSWNGLMIGALADGYRILGDERYLDAARRAANFLQSTLVSANGRLLRTYRAGTAHLNGYLEDYAYLSDALVDLYEAGGEITFLHEATRLVEEMVRSFADQDDGAFYHTSLDHESLIIRYREGSDGATPSFNAVAASACARLGVHLGRDDLRDAAIKAIKAYGEMILRFPRGFAKSLVVVDFLLEGPVELVLVGRRDAADTEAFRRALADHFVPNRVQAPYDPASDTDTEGLPLLQGKDLVSGGAALYVCREYACAAPITDVDRVAAALAIPRNGGSHSIAVRRPGAATPEGTARYVGRFGVVADSSAAREEAPIGHQVLQGTGLVTGRVGFGGYRTDDVTPQHKEALVRALMAGANLIDTSSNYMDGGSERLVGTVLNELLEEGDIRRDEIIVVSKLGYVQGTNLEHARDREGRGVPFPEMTKTTDDLWHCIHPEFLEDQLHRSLDRLELATLDVCLLHNPEYYLSQAERDGVELETARQEFYRRLTEAFRFFEAQADAGLLRWYGVSSNTLVSPSRGSDATSLSRILEAAEVVRGVDHRCRVVQVPLNLVESGAVFEKNAGPDHDQTVLDVARERGVGVLVNRPLNAFTGGSMLRLADVVSGDAEVDFDEQCEKVALLEKAFGERIAPGIVVPEGAMDPSRYFAWAAQLGSLRDDAMSLEQWSGVATQLQYRVGRISKILDHTLRGDDAARWLTWRDKYTAELGRLLAELRRQAAERATRETTNISVCIDPLLPEDRRVQSLSRKAIWVVASTPGVSVVLNGMRTPEYVRDSLGILEWPALEDSASVFGAVRSGVEDPER